MTVWLMLPSYRRANELAVITQPVLLRASIIVGFKLAKCWGGWEKGGEIREADCKLTASLCTGTKKPYERDKWTMY